uniref:Uncharacterized protein n=1 Tax=Salix viminalis TaxID=40686 RepID=A0A6N2KNB6_SALVM
MRGATRGLPRSEGRGGRSSPDFDRSFRRAFSFFSEFLGRNIGWIAEEGAWPDFGAGGIKSREGHSFEPIDVQRWNRRHGVKREGVKRADKKEKGTNKMRGATRGLPRRSPILVLLSPKHV